MYTPIAESSFLPNDGSDKRVFAVAYCPFCLSIVYRFPLISFAFITCSCPKTESFPTLISVSTTVTLPSPE